MRKLISVICVLVSFGSLAGTPQMASYKSSPEEFMSEMADKWVKTTFVHHTRAEYEGKGIVCFEKPRVLSFSLNPPFAMATYSFEEESLPVELAEFDLEDYRWVLKVYDRDTRQLIDAPEGCPKCHGSHENPHLILYDYNVWPGWDIPMVETRNHQGGFGDFNPVHDDFFHLNKAIWTRMGKQEETKLFFRGSGKYSSAFFQLKKSQNLLQKANNFLLDIAFVQRIYDSITSNLGSVPNDIKALMLNVAISNSSHFPQKENLATNKLMSSFSKKYPKIFREKPLNLKCSPDGYSFYDGLMREIYQQGDNPILTDHLGSSNYSPVDDAPKTPWVYLLSWFKLKSVNRKTFNRKSDFNAPCNSHDGEENDRILYPILHRFVMDRPFPKESLADIENNLSSFENEYQDILKSIELYRSRWIPNLSSFHFAEKIVNTYKSPPKP